MPRHRIPDRRERLLIAARELALEQGWSATTVSDVAERVGIGKGSMTAHLTDGAGTPGFERIIALAMEEAREKDRYGEKALDDWQIDWFGPFRMRFHSVPHLHRLTAPTLWVRGGRSRSIDPAAIEAAHRATPDSRMVTIAEAGHIVSYDRPRELGEAMRKFFAEVLGPPKTPLTQTSTEKGCP